MARADQRNSERAGSEFRVYAGLLSSRALGALQSDGGIPRFVRALVGLDREAAKRAFTEFLERLYTRSAIIDLFGNYLRNGF